MCSKEIKIIIRHYNLGSLEKCLDSLLQQTYKHFEVYIFDDEHANLSHLLELSDKSDKINIILITGKLISNEVMIYNKGQELSKNDWIIFLDERTVFFDTNSLTRISEHMDNKYNFISWKNKQIGVCFNTTDMVKPLWKHGDTLETVYNKLISSNYFRNNYQLDNICYELDTDKSNIIYCNIQDNLVDTVNNENNFFNNYLSGITEIPIYYINLDRSPERKNYILNEIAKTNTNLKQADIDLKLNETRITAIDGKDCENVLHYFTKNNVTPFENSSYEVACCLSHLHAIKKAYENNENIAIIMEDDVNLQFFHENYEKFSEQTKKLSNDTEILQILPFKEPVIGNSLYEQEIGFYKWKYFYYCAGMYLVTRKAMKKIIDRFFENDKLKVNYINCFISDLLIFSSCKTVTSNIPLALLTVTKSTIRARDDTKVLKADIIKSYNMSQKINS